MSGKQTVGLCGAAPVSRPSVAAGEAAATTDGGGAWKAARAFLGGVGKMATPPKVMTPTAAATGAGRQMLPGNNTAVPYSSTSRGLQKQNLVSQFPAGASPADLSPDMSRAYGMHAEALLRQNLQALMASGFPPGTAPFQQANNGQNTAMLVAAAAAAQRTWTGGPPPQPSLVVPYLNGSGSGNSNIGPFGHIQQHHQHHHQAPAAYQFSNLHSSPFGHQQIHSHHQFDHQQHRQQQQQQPPFDALIGGGGLHPYNSTLPPAATPPRRATDLSPSKVFARQSATAASRKGNVSTPATKRFRGLCGGAAPDVLTTAKTTMAVEATTGQQADDDLEKQQADGSTTASTAMTTAPTTDRTGSLSTTSRTGASPQLTAAGVRSGSASSLITPTTTAAPTTPPTTSGRSERAPSAPPPRAFPVIEGEASGTSCGTASNMEREKLNGEAGQMMAAVRQHQQERKEMRSTISRLHMELKKSQAQNVTLLKNCEAMMGQLVSAKGAAAAQSKGATTTAAVAVEARGAEGGAGGGQGADENERRGGTPKKIDECYKLGPALKAARESHGSTEAEMLRMKEKFESEIKKLTSQLTRAEANRREAAKLLSQRTEEMMGEVQMATARKETAERTVEEWKREQQEKERQEQQDRAEALEQEEGKRAAAEQVRHEKTVALEKELERVRAEQMEASRAKAEEGRQMEELKERLAAAETKFTEREKEFAEEVKSIRQKNDAKMAEMKTKLAEAGEDHKHLNDKNQDLAKQNKLMGEDLAAFRSAKQEATRKVCEAEEGRQVVQERLTRTEGQVEELTKEAECLRAEKDALEKELASERNTELEKASEELKSVRDEKEKLAGELKSLRDENEKLAGELKTVRDENEKLAGELKTVRDEKEKLAGELESVRDEKEKLAGELKSVRDEKEKLVRDREDDRCRAETEIKERKIANKALHSQAIEQLDTEIEKLCAKNVKIKMEAEEFREEAEKLREETKKLENELRDERSKATAEQKQRNEDEKTWKDKMDKLTIEMRDAEKTQACVVAEENSRLKQEVSENKLELDQLKESHREELAEISDRLELLKELNSRMGEAKNELETVAAAAEKQRASDDDARETLKQELEKAKKEASNYKRRLSKLERAPPPPPSESGCSEAPSPSASHIGLRAVRHSTSVGEVCGLRRHAVEQPERGSRPPRAEKTRSVVSQHQRSSMPTTAGGVFGSFPQPPKETRVGKTESGSWLPSWFMRSPAAAEVNDCGPLGPKPTAATPEVPAPALEGSTAAGSLLGSRTTTTTATEENCVAGVAERPQQVWM